jgi:pyrroline-5-carboxylate reductase
MDLTAHRIAFCGTGQMATALATGFCQQLLTPRQVLGYDPDPAARERFQSAVGNDATVGGSAAEIVAEATIVVLAVKPQVLPHLLPVVKPLLHPTQLVISIAAGVSLAALAEQLPSRTRLVRVMPNTPCLIGRGACGFCGAETATNDDMVLVEHLLQTVGIAESIPEHLMDVVTGLSGSGPAYVYQMIQALSDGAVKNGMPRAIALRMAAQTVVGAAEMVLQLQQHPAVLTDAVTSPGGTTIAGLHALTSGGFHAAVMDAVEAATRRSAELGG